MMDRLLTLLIAATSAMSVGAFAPVFSQGSTHGHILMMSVSESTTESRVELSLPKPLGLILEEVEEGTAQGVFVQEVSDAGSAAAHADQIMGAKLATVMGNDVTMVDFDTAMDAIINAPDIVDLTFVAGEEQETTTSDYALGDAVSVVVKQDGKEDLVISAKVGDNLRKTLLENDFEVYQGLKQKLGNCGGGGQCTFCAVDFLESEGWEERSDYEDKMLAKFPKARLSCLNNIQGPTTIQKTAR